MARSVSVMEGGGFGGPVRVRVAVAVGTLSVAVLAGLMPTLVAAAGPSEAEASAVVEPLPLTPPSPVEATPPSTRPTPGLKPTNHGEAPDYQQPSAPMTGQPYPAGESPGDPDPLRPDEPPAAAVLSEPTRSPGVGAGVGPGPTPSTRPGGPFPPVGGSPTERVRIIIAGAMLSGIAAITGWFLLGARRREQRNIVAPRSSGTADVPAQAIDVDAELLLIAPDGLRRDHRAVRAPSVAPPALWQAEDDRPRWVRRLDDQNPARPAARRPAPPPDEHATPWIEPDTQNGDEGETEVPR